MLEKVKAKMRTFGTGAMKYNYRLSEFHAAIRKVCDHADELTDTGAA